MNTLEDIKTTMEDLTDVIIKAAKLLEGLKEQQKLLEEDNKEVVEETMSLEDEVVVEEQQQYYNLFCSHQGLTSLVGVEFEKRCELTSTGVEDYFGDDFQEDCACSNGFDCSWNELTSLKGCPEEIEGNFICSSNKLTSLKGGPKVVNGKLYSCSWNPLNDLTGCSKELKGDFFARSCGLKSLKGAPKRVEGCFDFPWNNVTSLKGAPEYVGDYFECSNNDLVTLEGMPKKIGSDIYCQYNQLKSLKGAPKRVKGCFDIYHNEPLEDISDLPSNLREVNLEDCPNVKIFTKKITNRKGLLTFYGTDEQVDERIRQWPYYEIVSEEGGITVRIKKVNK